MSGGATLAGTITLTGDARIGAHDNAGSNTITGNIGESGGSYALEFGGTNSGGKIILSGTAAHTGGTTIGLGTLQLGAAERFNATGNIHINGGTLDLGTYTQTAATVSLTSGTLSNGTLQAGTLTTAIDSAATINNLTFQGGLTKTGTGTLTLSGTNTYDGNIAVSQGTLLLTNVGAASTAAGHINVADGATLGFTINGTDTWTAAQISAIVQDGSTFASNATLGINLTTGSSEFDAAFLTGNRGLTKLGGGTLSLGSGTSDTTANTYTGLTTISAGTLNLNKAANTIAIAGDLLITGSGILSMNGNANQIASTANLTFEGGGKLGSNGQKIVETVNDVTVKGRGGNFNPGSGSDLTVNSLTFLDSTGSASNQYSIAANSANSTLTIGAGGWAMTNSTYSIGQNGNYTATVKLNGDFTGSGTNTVTAGANNSNPTLDAKSTINLQGGTRTFNITDGTTTIGPKLTNGSLTKAGSGTLVLVGSNTYAGLTTVTGGKLVINGDQSSATGNVVVMSGGTLGGTGIIGGEVTIGTGGYLAPGNSAGTLSFANNVTLENGAWLVLEINGTAEGEYDMLNFTTSGSKLEFEQGAKLYILLADGVSLSSGLLVATGTNLSIIGAESLGITSSTGQEFKLGSDGTLTAIPEPSTYAAGMLAMLGALALVRRRFKK
jgi:fibronectin-binding autotransporter adhesin